MGTVYSIRGTNGSGKTTLARRFLPPNLKGQYAKGEGGDTGGPVDLCFYPSPTKTDPDREKRVEGYIRLTKALGTVGAVGSYDASCGGMDKIPSFEIQRNAISYMLAADRINCDHVIAEGLLASGVYGSWADYARLLAGQGHRYLFIYLHTPLDVCVERVRARQASVGKAGKDFKVLQVETMMGRAMRGRAAAMRDGMHVYDLPPSNDTNVLAAMLTDIMLDNQAGQALRAKGAGPLGLVEP